MNNKVFVSYANPDLDMAKALVGFLKSAGVKTWFDKDDLLAGQDWDAEIAREIRECAIVLVCLSSKAIPRRGYFHKEMRTALDVAMTIPPKQLYMMPFKLDQCEIPDELARYHVADLFEENSADILLKSLSFALKTELQASEEAKKKFQAAIQNRVSSTDVISIALPATLSNAARSLLSEILKDDRSDPKGLSLMMISSTQGSFLPYLWDNSVHGGQQVALVNIARIRMAADELTKAGIVESLPQEGELKQYVLRPQYEALPVEGIN